ncbi:MAG: hemerythrin domain-containing protein [bacterium]
MATSKPRTSAHETAEAIHREHETLRALLTRIKATKELPALLQLLEQLRAQLEDHFQTEERPDGLHAVILGREPRFATALERILDEHKAILKDVDELLVTTRDCVTRSDALVGHVLRLAEHLHDHELRETQLFADTSFIDLGGRSS